LADPLSFVAGVRKRFAYLPPIPYIAFYAELLDFVFQWCIDNLIPLASDSDVGVPTWLDGTNYPEYRKQALLDLLNSHDHLQSFVKWWECKLFAKDEPYPTYKHLRGINSRSDRFKIEVGPIFKLIESVVYSNPYFIKHIPVADRPNYIYNRLFVNGGHYFPTDYTAFEALFVSKLMFACEFVMYDYMTSKLSINSHFMSLCHDVIAGSFRTVNKNFFVEVLATRMSGEMNTSLGNGFSNLMFMLFACHKVGSISVTGVVEGDDGLFSITGNAPTCETFLSMGLVIKMVPTDDLCSASFCGCVFDLDDRINICDPVKVLLNTGWTTFQYSTASKKTLDALLVAKAFSLIFQYPGAPIIQSFALYIIRNVNVKKNKLFKVFRSNQTITNYEKVINVVKLYGSVLPVRIVPVNTRLLMERCFKVPVDLQIQIENYFDTATVIKPFSFPALELFIHPDATHYFQNYCRQVDVEQCFLQSEFIPFVNPNEFTIEQY